jgi:hypothetical protein
MASGSLVESIVLAPNLEVNLIKGTWPPRPVANPLGSQLADQEQEVTA